ncbi:hydroxymethylbilane synthase [Caminibacter mediatlanticus TB-2]|uniref:Porphobilinogen deaminase n=1 Tax=Caminibacter mediatlanticus TB-2 TaxID=391592 RepID=A0ABX5V7W5_9BACT|nr:hydroxymethylbilane synthase [Caminibacter mediatlanticus]QCT94378.1 hydroxymethylbilane synthase [Caminibacter mediatlanticus TB-2]
MKLTIATRGSKLALWQAEWVKKRLENLGHEVDLKIVTTTGDKILDKPLASIGGKGLFIKEVEEALHRGEAQIAVHSLKDFPTEYNKEHFTLAAVPKREAVEDVFLSETFETLAELPHNAVVGTSSIRRAMQLKAFREDLVISDLRGNVDTRINKLKKGEYDAIILAYAGVKRLNMIKEVKYFEILDTDIMIPAMGQGALGIETIKDEKVIEAVKPLNDLWTKIEVTIERDFVDELNLGCHAPVGVNAKIMVDDSIKIKAAILDKNNKVIKKEMVVSFDEWENAGREFAEEFKEYL